MTVCNLRSDSAYMTKFKMFHMHTDGAASNSIHCAHIFPAIFKNNDASQRVKSTFNRMIIDVSPIPILH